MFGWTSETWQMIGKYGLATVLTVMLLVFFMHHFTRQANQLDQMHQTNKDIVATNEKVAAAIDKFGDVTEDMTKEIDDVGDAVRIMVEVNK